MRKMISFKIENLPDKQRKIIDDWANSQSNIQQSMANVIQHVVSLIGNEDVMDFDVQRKLHVLFGNGTKVNDTVVRHVQSEQQRSYEQQYRDTIEINKAATVENEQSIYTKADWFKDDE